MQVVEDCLHVGIWVVFILSFVIELSFTVDTKSEAIIFFSLPHD